MRDNLAPLPSDPNDSDPAHQQVLKYGKDLARVYQAEKAKREELELANQALNAVFANTPDGLLVLDDSYVVQQVNPVFLKWVEMSIESIIGQNIAKILPSPEYITEFRNLAASNQKHSVREFVIDSPIKRSFMVNIVRMETAQKTEWLLVFHDQSKRKQLEYQKNEFISIAAHELRTPLIPMLGATEMLLMDLEDTLDNEQRQLLEDSRSGGMHLLKIVEEMLNFAQLTQGNLKASEISDVVLRDLISGVIADLQNNAQEKEVTLEYVVDDSIESLISNAALLRTAVYQLTLNGINFNQAGGNVEIKAVSAGNNILIQVIDDGTGILQSDLENIFEPFFQAEDHLTRSVGGLGLGLSIARRTIKQLGGQLSVESEIGKGSNFFFEIPSHLSTHVEELEDAKKKLEVTQKQSLFYARDLQSLYHRLQEHTVATLTTMINTLEARDSYTRGHTDRVTEYTLEIARRMDFSEQDLRTLRIAGQIHDIGKIGVPDATLNKPGRLTDEEYEIIKTHMTIGPKLVEGLDFLKEATPIAFAHHERWDGKGYPHGLAGEDIPLGGRVMAVADAYDAMTSARPYRKGMPQEKAMQILREGAGSQWDAHIVEVFLKILDGDKE